jgi:uncharacterized membrane protein
MLASTLRRHGRFIVSLLLGLALWGASSFSGLDAVMRAVIGVNGFYISYLSSMLWMILATSAEDLRRHSEADDEGAFLILVLAVLAVGISLASIFLVLNRNSDSLAEALFALTAAPMGWATLHVLAAFRYAHLFYAPDPDGGLEFPGTKEPGISEFLYFSFTIGMTAQVSDVVVTAANLRPVVLLHSIGSFFFNTVILALAVNAAVNLSKDPTTPPTTPPAISAEAP